jgi:hypothetical protein
MLAARCVTGPDLRNLGLLALELLHVEAILLRSSLRLLFLVPDRILGALTRAA